MMQLNATIDKMHFFKTSCTSIVSTNRTIVQFCIMLHNSALFSIVTYYQRFSKKMIGGTRFLILIIKNTNIIQHECLYQAKGICVFATFDYDHNKHNCFVQSI